MNPVDSLDPGAVIEATRSLHMGAIYISLTNLLIILVMVVVFILALVIPFPRQSPVEAPSTTTPRRGRRRAGTMTPQTNPTPAPTENESSWTVRVRHWIFGIVPRGEALPDKQPEYVASWIYVFGVLTVASLLVVLATGALLAIGGSAWWHVSSLGHFVNSLHLWSVEIFFAVMVIHLWGQFWMAAWRGKRLLTWVTGVVAFVASIATAFTGYLSQSNFDSQWISGEAKDGLNSVGVGAWFNVLNPGQMLMWHVLLLPFAVGIIAVVHIILVRRHGVVPPIDAEGRE